MILFYWISLGSELSSLMRERWVNALELLMIGDDNYVNGLRLDCWWFSCFCFVCYVTRELLKHYTKPLVVAFF